MRARRRTVSARIAPSARAGGTTPRGLAGAGSVVVRTVGRGHVHDHAIDTSLIADRTADGGTHWTATAIALAR